VYNEETLNLNESLLLINPEFYTLWAYRKDYFILKFEECPEQKEVHSAVELRLVEKALKKNPKSYVAWYHREWVVDHGKVDLEHELGLCNQFLALDSRNCK
jgi:geranylgeranyl transferase type-2 subunit alpha